MNECKKCGYHEDIKDDLCEGCRTGNYHCACGNSVTEHEIETVGVCGECR